GAAGEAGYAAVVDHVSAVEVGDKLDLLARPDLRQLCFLEVGIDIDLPDRDERHHRRAGGDPLTDLDLAVGDDAVDRGADDGPLQVKARLPEFGLGGRNFRTCFNGRAGNQRFVRSPAFAGRATRG